MQTLTLPTVRLWDEASKSMVPVTLSLVVDWEAVALQLARQARASKYKKATQLHGALKAKIV